jgi:hypothetical protein
VPSAPRPDTGKRAFLPHIEDRAKSIGHRDAEQSLLFCIRYMSVVKTQNSWNCNPTAKRRRHGHFQPGRIHVGEFVQAQGRLVAVDACRAIGSITRP